MTGQMTQEGVKEYQSMVLKLYLQLPETPSKASSHDRKTAAMLHASGFSVDTVESALLLASLRRLGRSSDMPSLSPIRSLAYFFPVIQEMLANPVPKDYVEHLREKLLRLSQKIQSG
jgi:hypothetical protein